MTEQIDFPDVHQAELDQSTLDALFLDLETCTEVTRVILKAAPERYARERADLGTAHALLAAAEVRGVQIDYRFEGGEWTDTLIRTPGGVRLVRVRHSRPAE